MLSERVTSAPRFNCTSSTPMNVQIGSRCVKLCRMFLKGRNTDMFHTCTNMTWSHFLILKPEILKWQTHMRFGSACSTNFFLNIFLLSSQLLSVWAVLLRGILYCIRPEGKSLGMGGFSSKSNWFQLDLSVKTRIEKLDGDAHGESPCRLEAAVWCTFV